MTIGVDVSRAFRKEKTGVEWYVFHLMRALHALDVKNEYRFYSDQEPPEDIEQSLRSKIVVLRWPFRSLWTQGRLSLEMLLRPPDVLLITASAMPVIHPSRTVVVEHDVGFLVHTDYRNTKEIRYLKWSTHYAIRHAWRIVTVSEWTKQEILGYYRDCTPPISVAHNGIDQKYYHRLSSDDSQETMKRLCVCKPFFLSVGRLDPRKNIITLIKAFCLFAKKNPSYSLVVAGPAGYGSQETLEAMKNAEKSGVTIQYLSWISEGDKRALLSECTAFIFPSFYEGFGMPLVEAQLCQAPIIASDIPVFREVGGGAALFFDPHDSNALLRQMENCVDNEDQRKKLQMEGLRNAKRFDWGTTASHIDAVCRDT